MSYYITDIKRKYAVDICETLDVIKMKKGRGRGGGGIRMRGERGVAGRG